MFRNQTIALMALVFSLLQEAACQWSYTQNGADWASLGVCGGQGSGAQSPVDLPVTAGNDTVNSLWLKYPHLGHAIKMYNDGHSIAFTLPAAYRSGFGFGPSVTNLASGVGEAYRLWQVNFHAPSEHTINGRRMPLEMQMMHKAVTGGSGLAAIVVFFDESTAASDPFLHVVTEGGLPQRPWEEVAINAGSTAPTSDDQRPDNSDIGFQHLLEGSPFLSYEGSLTVPPCESHVKYFVRAEPVMAGSSQLRPFQHLLKKISPPNGNYRKIITPGSAVGQLTLVQSGDGFVQNENGTSHLAGVLKASNNGSSTVPTPSEVHAIMADPNSIRIEENDTAEMREAKQELAQAQNNVEVVEEGAHQLEHQLHEEQRQYDQTVGTVGKMDQAFDVLQNQDELTRVEHAVVHEEERVEEAAEHVAELRVATETTSSQMTTSTTTLVTEEGSDHVATTLDPNAVITTTQSPGRGELTEYIPRVELPTGLAFSPFRPSAFGAAVPSSVGAAPPYAMRIAANLQQPDMPRVSIPSAISQPSSPADSSPSTSTTVEPEEVFFFPVDASTQPPERHRDSSFLSPRRGVTSRRQWPLQRD